MPVTITRAQFKTAIARSFPNYRSKRLDKVLASFKLYELDTGSRHNLDRLRGAVERWIVSDPKEFNKRNTLGNGMCRRLATELDVRVHWDGSNREVISAHLLTPATAGGGAARATADSSWLNCSLEDRMLELHTQGKADTTAVFLIDMQSKNGATLRDGETAYNDYSVIDNQVSVLQAAAAYGMHVVEIRISTTLNAQSDDGKEVRVLHDDPSLPALATAMEQVTQDKFVSIAKPFYNSFQGTTLEADLAKRGIGLVIMMGFDANLCVLNTIFGTPASHVYKKEGREDVAYLPGLLDRGIAVLTSRVVLASSNGDRLMPIYGMTG